MTSSKTVGDNIRRLRKRLGMTQEKLAELASIEPRSVIAIEGGSRNPTLKTLTRISKALSINLSELLD